LIEATGQSKATLSRQLKSLMSDGIIHKQPALYTLSTGMTLIRPLEEKEKVYLVKDTKRIKGKKHKLIPLSRKGKLQP